LASEIAGAVFFAAVAVAAAATGVTYLRWPNKLRTLWWDKPIYGSIRSDMTIRILALFYGVGALAIAAVAVGLCVAVLRD
jgi:hypothetical protein